MFKQEPVVPETPVKDVRIPCVECGELHFQNSASRFCLRCWRTQTLMVARANAAMQA
ncbi:hypothetical protein HNQ59_001964 [Chitinivorax tropicus]|uniref:Uncharacterized protein n=1 Tax=Chitinivorax tropicus TaxID=714531 RepID=A0A840MR41_9PROT|nr:hypothetical protein [Chitinivorax tropicus]